MNRFLACGGILLLLTALVVPGVVRAEDPAPETPAVIQVGPVIVNPSLTLKETFTDNALFSENDPKSDLITTVAPGVKLRLPFRMHELSLGARAEFLMYLENTSLNTSPYEVFGRGDFSIGDRLKLKVGDTYQRNEESSLESPNGTSDVYTANAAALSVKYAFVDVSQVQLDYTRVSLNYLDSDYRTREEDRVSVYLYYRVLPNTSGFLEYDFKNVAYDNTTQYDNTVHSGLIGATWEISENSKGTAKAGLLSKLYADATLEDYSTWTASVDLQHRLTDAASLRLLGKREVNEGKENGIRYYTTTGVFADFTYRFLDRLSGVIEGAYSSDTFSDALKGEKTIREDTTAHIGVGMKYSFNNWLDLALGYGYSNRNSNFERFDAVINTVTLKVTAYR